MHSRHIGQAQIKKIFYDHWGAASPNPAHCAVASMQKHGWVDTIVTQNIDALHQRAGAQDVVEFHGTLDRLICTKCRFRSVPTPELLSGAIPSCPDCGAMLKPDFVFFGEGIPEEASDRAFASAMKAAAILVVGTSGEVMPACQLPYVVKRHGGTVIEVNPDEELTFRVFDRKDPGHPFRISRHRQERYDLCGEMRC